MKTLTRHCAYCVVLSVSHCFDFVNTVLLCLHEGERGTRNKMITSDGSETPALISLPCAKRVNVET